MRIKEDSHDYRYFPEPDLLPVKTGEMVEKMKSAVPELPHEKKDRFVRDYSVSAYDASVLTGEIVLADYFEAAVQDKKLGKKVANWIINAVLGKLNETFLTIEENPIQPTSLFTLVQMVESATVSNNQAKEVFDVLWESPEKDPVALAKEMGFEPADTSEIEAIVDEVIAANPEKVAEIQGGNPKLANWLTGQVMKASKGKANPKMVTDLIVQKLGLA